MKTFRTVCCAFFLVCLMSNVVDAADFDKKSLFLRAFVADVKLASEVISGNEPDFERLKSQVAVKAHFLVVQTRNETGFIAWGQVATKIPGVYKEYILDILDAKSGSGSIWTTTIVDLGGIDIKIPSGTAVEARWETVKYK